MAAAEKKVSPEEDKEGDEDQMGAATITSSGRSVPEDSPLRQVQTTGKSIIVRNEESGQVNKVNDYNVIKLLGTGSFAEVYLVEQAGKQFAVKCFDKSVLSKRRTFSRAKSGRMVVSTAMDQVAGEVAIMKKLRHPNLVSLHEVIDDQDESMMFMVLDFVAGGELMTWDEAMGKFASNEGGLFTEARAAKATQDVISGLTYLHMNHIAHRDLKPENLLVGSDGEIKIADFGVSHFFEHEEEKQTVDATKEGSVNQMGQLTKTEGTYYFFAPEMCTKGAFNAYVCDVWALGICLWAMVFGTLPFKGANPVELFELIQNQEIAFPEPKSPELQDILHGFLEKDPTERISLEDASEHVWFMKMQLKKSHDEPSMRVTVTDEDIKQAIGRRNSQTKSNFMAPQSEGGGTFTKDTRRKMSIIQAPGQTNIWEAQSSGANSNQMDKMAEEEDESASPAPSPVAEPAALSPTDPSIPATSTAASAAPTAASTAAVVDQIGKKKKDRVVRLSSCCVS